MKISFLLMILAPMVTLSAVRVLGPPCDNTKCACEPKLNVGSNDAIGSHGMTNSINNFDGVASAAIAPQAGYTNGKVPGKCVEQPNCIECQLKECEFHCTVNFTISSWGSYDPSTHVVEWVIQDDSGSLLHAAINTSGGVPVQSGPQDLDYDYPCNTPDTTRRIELAQSGPYKQLAFVNLTVACGGCDPS